MSCGWAGRWQGGPPRRRRACGVTVLRQGCCASPAWSLALTTPPLALPSDLPSLPGTSTRRSRPPTVTPSWAARTLTTPCCSTWCRSSRRRRWGLGWGPSGRGAARAPLVVRWPHEEGAQSGDACCRRASLRGAAALGTPGGAPASLPSPSPLTLPPLPPPPQGIDLTKDKLAVQRLREAAEKAKCELSRCEGRLEWLAAWPVPCLCLLCCAVPALRQPGWVVSTSPRRDPELHGAHCVAARRPWYAMSGALKYRCCRTACRAAA